jgi:hypothetical protein
MRTRLAGTVMLSTVVFFVVSVLVSVGVLWWTGDLLASMLVFSAPAFADKGGVSHDGSCGLSKESVHNEIENPSSPGASEAGHFPFGDCKGKG